ncbi:thiazole synthase [Rheinheimera texasensis]|uniref:thiazole synthase n=1 Tax=Rheinheimera texasensis TaxID=306205 RepID=UPI0004E24F3B|nr:thiazole synthase [Rheinheimera texasensis]
MLTIAGKTFHSHLLLGSGKFQSALQMQQAVRASGTELVTLALKRLQPGAPLDDLFSPLQALGVQLLPNTSGARTAEEAVQAALLAREAVGTHWLKLEIHPEPKYLLPDPRETLKAAEKLCDLGFVVLPYCSADPLHCKQLEQAGCAAVMPLGAPIGSNQGLQNRAMLEIIIEQANIPVIIDAGLGAPSDATLALELGANAVLVNTAIASSTDPVRMAQAFRLAVEAGVLAQQSGLGMRQARAQASSPLEPGFAHLLAGLS